MMLLDEDIIALRYEAAANADTRTVTLCNLALDRRHTNPQYQAARVKVAEILKRRAA